MKEQALKMSQVAKIISEKYGTFKLFALFLREDSLNKWDLLISSDWALSNKKKSLNIIVDELKKVLDEKELTMLSRVIILEKNDPILQSLTQTVRVEQGMTEIQNSVFSGLMIRQAYIMTSI